MSLCVISGTVTDVSGSPLSGLPVVFNMQTPILLSEPVQGSTATATDGTWSLSLSQGLSGIMTISAPNTSSSRSVLYKFNVIIPATVTAPFSSIVVDN